MLTEKLKVKAEKDPTVSLGCFSNDINKVFHASFEHLFTDTSGITAVAGLKLISKISSSLEDLCFQQNPPSSVYKSLLNYILHKTTELASNSQQFMLEAISFDDYEQISKHAHVIRLLAQSTSLFVAILKLLTDCVCTIANQFFSIISPDERNIADSRLTICIFTNIGYLLRLLQNILVYKTNVLADLQKQEGVERAELKAETPTDEKLPSSKIKPRKQRKLSNSKKLSQPRSSSSVLSSCITPSFQTALIIHEGGNCLPSVLDQLRTMNLLMEKAPLCAMFSLKCQFLVEKLQRIVIEVIQSD